MTTTLSQRPALASTFSSMKADIPRAVRLVFAYTPGWTTANILLIFILGLLPLASLYIMKLLVDTVTSGITAVDKNPVFHQLIVLLVAAAALSLFTACLRALASYVTENQSLVMTDRISDLIHSHSIALDLAYYENAEYRDTLHRAQSAGPSRPGRVVNDIVQIGQNCISIIAVGMLVISFSPLAGIVLVCAAIPAAVFRLWHSQKLYTLRVRQTEAERRSWYYHSILTGSYHAKEIRLFGLGPFFRDRYRSIQDVLRSARLALSRSQALWDIVSQGFITAAIFGSFAVIAFMTVEGTITIGDMVVYFMAFQMCIGYVQSIFGSLNALYEDQLFLHNLFQFLDLVPAIAAPPNPVPVPSPLHDGIRFEGVTFTYHGMKSPVLSNVNLTLHKGEVIALVGENGAGKSTLIKLLCMLYVPDTGTITADGVDLVKTDPDEWRRRIAILFQDYMRYQLTARENIWLADTGLVPGSPRVEGAAHQAGADSIIRRLPQGYDTMLGNYFTGSRELSTGEWQKIALARAFFRNSEIVILDEPASSLDALAEAEIFTKFREIIDGRSAILISHRFSTVLMADHIYFLERGEITEHGTHAELMANDGRYAAMFRAQADPYRK